MIRLEFGSDTLARLFPAYLCVGPDGTIHGAGPALRRITGGRILGLALAEALVAVPDLVAAVAADQLLQLRLRDPALDLVGSAFAQGENFLLALGIVADRTWPVPHGLQIDDFAPSDPAVTAIMQSGVQAALVEESKTMALELAAERERVIELAGRISRSSAYVAHEFNNLTSIIGLNCDRLLRDHGQDEAMARLVRVIRDTASRGLALTRSMLVLADRDDDSDAVFALDGLLAVHRAYFSLVAGAELVVGWNLDAGEALVRVSESALVDWLARIFIRARELAGPGARITAGTSSSVEGGRPMVEIVLRATGMNPADADPWRATERLAAFIAQADGTIEQLCEAGGAFTLVLRLPLASRDGEVEVAAPQSIGRSPVPAGARVLVVDDEPYALEALEELLAGFGYAVTACDGPDGALAALARERFDVLLTDVIMPGISGLDLAEAAERAYPGLAIVLMSGFLPDGGARREAWHFLRKPLDVAGLAE
ncbi:MAG: response regulator, partial [Sphingomonadales bacterium]|nr:response regulator [Sphingomonadales bacterium]